MATARIVGLNCSLKPVHICIGIVVFSKPARNNTTTTSSKDVTKANNPPEITPGSIYHVLMYGINAMGSHAGQVNEEERWQIAQYVMELREEQKSN